MRVMQLSGSVVLAMKSPKQVDSDAIRMIFNRAWRIQNIRSYTLDMNTKRRHEFKSTHSLRKYFETHALNHMKLLNVKMLMGHDTGLEKSYYKPTEKQILDHYLNVVDLLTISNENKLQRTVETLTIEKSKMDSLFRDIELLKKKNEMK